MEGAFSIETVDMGDEAKYDGYLQGCTSTH